MFSFYLHDSWACNTSYLHFFSIVSIFRIFVDCLGVSSYSYETLFMTLKPLLHYITFPNTPSEFFEIWERRLKFSSFPSINVSNQWPHSPINCHCNGHRRRDYSINPRQVFIRLIIIVFSCFDSTVAYQCNLDAGSTKSATSSYFKIFLDDAVSTWKFEIHVWKFWNRA